jgi:hypothetical protein
MSKTSDKLRAAYHISNETCEKTKDQLLPDETSDLRSYNDLMGRKLFFRAVTYHCVGKVINRLGDFLELEQASWVADSGRFMNAIKYGALMEVEPVGQCWVNLKTVVDFFPWEHELPTEQK